MYWRFFMSWKSSAEEAAWKWELCRENHAAFKSAAREFCTLTDCMRDAAQHGYRGWADDLTTADSSLQQERMPMSVMATSSPYFGPGNQRLH
ncbi:MAG TPA: hypothetical protein VLN59_14215 [Burkholderiales bacterium]|nr:hypothetical protein [Burkholderiales bacterium]